ncbi:MAG: acyl-CoA synthetase [Pseudomonadales bacterium]
MKAQHIRTAAHYYPQKPALIMADSGKTLNYRELSSRANRCAQLLFSLGLRAGDRFALLMENRSEFIEICWAGINSGLLFTPISTHLKADEVAFIVDDCDAKVIFFSHQTEGILDVLDSHCPQLMAAINVSCKAQYEDALVLHNDRPLEQESRGAPMVYSSGTTGRPKGIVPQADDASPMEPTRLSQLLARLYDFNEETVYLSPAPLYHTAPLKFNLTVTAMGGTTVICERFHEEAALAYIERYRITHSQWVPTMFKRFLMLPEAMRKRYDYSSQRFVIHAAAPCPPAVKRAMIDWWGPILYEYYAGSESVGLCAISPEEFEHYPGSVGRAVKGSIHILDEHGKELPMDQTGTIYFEGGGNFAYHKDSQKTRSAYNANGWSTFGDLGYLDADGYLYLSDRREDLIISGGVNIYPQEIENLLIEHPLVADAAVFGVSNEEYGEEVKACVQLINPAQAGPNTEEILLNYCRARLSHIKCPGNIDFLDTLPRYANGKLHKRELKTRFEQPMTDSR